MAAGILTGDTTANDPKLSNTSGFSLAADDVAHIVVRLKKSATATTGGEYFWRNEDGSFHSTRRDSFTTINDGQFHTYFLTPSASANAINWIGKTINGLRLDPNRAADGSSFEIDYILFSDGDFDNDGSPDADEQIAGTLFDDSQSVFGIRAALPNLGSSDFVLEWEAVAGRTYRVYGSTNLHVPFSLLPDGTVNAPQNSYTDTVYSAEDAVFFRLDVQAL